MTSKPTPEQAAFYEKLAELLEPNEPSPSPDHNWSLDPVDYHSREYLDHQEFLANLRQTHADAVRKHKTEQVQRRLRYEAMVRDAKAAGDGYPPYDEYREPGDEGWI